MSTDRGSRREGREYVRARRRRSTAIDGEVKDAIPHINLQHATRRERQGSRLADRGSSGGRRGCRRIKDLTVKGAGTFALADGDQRRSERCLPTHINLQHATRREWQGSRCADRRLRRRPRRMSTDRGSRCEGCGYVRARRR